jgi:hypothetical protein
MSTSGLRLAFVIDAVDRATARVRAVNERIDRIADPVRRVRASFSALYRESRFDQITGSVGRLGEAAGGLAAWGGGVATMLATMTAGATAFGFALKGVVDRVDAMNDRAAVLGMGVDQLSRMGYAAQLNGSSVEEMAQALEFLANNQTQALQGSKELAAWFQRAGISLDQLRKMNAGQVFEAIADQFGRVGDAGGNAEKKIALMRALMGRSGAGLKQVLDQGSEGLRGFYAEADRLGVTISQDTARAIGAMGDNIDRTRLTLFGLAAVITSKLTPVLTPLLDRLAEWVARNKELTAGRVAAWVDRILPKLPAFGNAVWQIVQAAAGLAAGLNAVADFLGGWQNLIGLVAGVIVAKGVMAVVALTQAMWALGAAMVATPIGLVIAGIAGLVAAGAYLVANWGRVKEFFAGLGETIDRVLTGIERLGFIGRAITAPFRVAQMAFNGPAAPAAGGAAQAATWGRETRAEIGGTLRIVVDTEGRVRTVDADRTPGSPLMLDVYEGRPLWTP